MNIPRVRELLLQSLEHERGGVKIYRMAIQCARNAQLREEWREYLQQTERHVQVLTDACVRLEIDPGVRTPGCEIVRQNGAALLSIKAGAGVPPIGFNPTVGPLSRVRVDSGGKP